MIVAPVAFVPKDYAAALQVADRLGQDVKEAEGRAAEARDRCFPFLVAYLEAADALYSVQQRRERGEKVDGLIVSATHAIGRADRELRARVVEAKREESALLTAQAEHQKAARLAEALL